MPGFFLAFLAVALCSLGSRDQLIIARLSGVLGRHVGLLFAGLTTAIVTALIAGLAGQAVSALLSPAAKDMLVAMALFFAAIELAWPNREHKPREPARSLVATAIVLFVRQLGDASRFMIFALTAGAGVAAFPMAGGMLGSAVATAAAWAGDRGYTGKLPLQAIRWVLAVPVLIASAAIGLSARGLLD